MHQSKRDLLFLFEGRLRFSFMASQELLKEISNAEKYIERHGADIDAINAFHTYVFWANEKDNDIETALKIAPRAKELMNQYVINGAGGNIWELEKFCFANKTGHEMVDKWYEILKLEAPHKFESFIYYMEKNRPYAKRFYLPRRNPMKTVVSDLQDLEDRKSGKKFYGLSMPSRVGKSTDCIFFLTWIGLKRPNSHSAMGGHSGILAKGFYKELMNLITTPEYTFKELFDYVHPEYQNRPFPTDKSADEFTITLGDPDRFATITCRGIDGTWTGAVDVSADGYLYVDDLVRDREHSLSPIRMDNTYQEYLNKMVDRKNDGARELMVGTLWNVTDPLERTRKQYEDNPEYFFRKIPALNEKDESNFDYEINGFSTKYYHEMRDRLDKAEWMAKFMQQPFVREGLLFPTDELQFFNGILPDGDFRIVAAVDVAWGGGDSLSMPIGAEYESGDVYVFAWVFNKGAKEVTLPLVTGQIINNRIRQIRFEGNTGGDLYCKYVDEMLQKQGWKCSCTHRKAPNTMEKMSKIIAYSGDIKRKYHFLTSRIPTKEERERDRELGIIRYIRNEEYQNAMDELETFVTIGKNDYDDAVDGLTQLEMFIENPNGTVATVEAVQNPFRTGGYGYGF